MAAPVLATTRYTEIGTYIGQFFLPGAGNLPTNVRVPCLVGRGDRNIVINNAPFRRSFVTGEQLSFSTFSPFVATTVYASDGTQTLPVKLYTNGGVEVPANKWEWLQVLGEYAQVHLLDTAFDPFAIYYLDYQSTSREVVDVIPEITIQVMTASAQIREIMTIGTIQDLDEFDEYKDFYLNFEIDPVAADPGNANTTRSFSPVTADVLNSGTGTVNVSTSAAYAHNYDRLYTFEVTASAGVTPTRTATMSWSAAPVSLGNSALPATPLNPVQDRPTFSLDEGNLLSLPNQLCELGVIVDFDFGVTNYVIGDKFYVQARGPGLLELDAKLSNTNQFTELSVIVPTLQPASTGSMVYDCLPTDYNLLDYNLSIRMVCIDATGTVGAGNRVATFVWSGYGPTLVSGAFTYSQLVVGSDVQPIGATGLIVKLSFGATHFVAEDQFDFQVLSPRSYYKGKESVRNLTLGIGSVNTAVADKATVSGSYLSDTAEGRFGVWQADTTVNNGRFELPDGLKFFVRNAYLNSLVATPPGGSMLAAGDKFTTQCRSLGTLDFNLDTELTQIIANPSQIATDVAGAVTGTVGAKYINLDYVPLSILILKRVTTGAPVAYTQIPNTPFLVITEVGFDLSYGDLSVTYRHSGGEPQPGQVYYVTAKYLRPAAFYNQPILFLTGNDAKGFLAPSTTKNDLYIGAQICWDYAIQGLFCIQVKDADDDGLYSRDDFKVATNAFLQDKRATDLVVLNNFASLPDQLQAINRSSDPFENHECMTFIGAPIGTPVGSENQTGTLVSLAKRTLAVYGQNPAHGTRTIVSATRATRTITLEDKSSTVVTLDGSFVAAALASLQDAFADPKETVLLKTITSFNTLQTYRYEENLLLGAAQVIYLKDEGNGVYRIYEDVTTDGFSSDTKNLNQMTQKQFVTRDIRTTVNGAIISLVFPSASAGQALIQSILVERLGSLVSSGFIGRYQDADGNERDIDSGSDTIVFIDKIDPTLFHIGYNYFLATVAKRVFGLYTVNLPGGFPR